MVWAYRNMFDDILKCLFGEILEDINLPKFDAFLDKTKPVELLLDLQTISTGNDVGDGAKATIQNMIHSILQT